MPELKYIGRKFLHGIPARNLRADEIVIYGGISYLVGTGLYELVEEPEPEEIEPVEIEEEIVEE